MKDKIEQYLESLGLDTFGWVKARPLEELRAFYQVRQEKGIANEFEESNIKKRIDPEASFPGTKTILSIAFPYLGEEDGVENGFSVYTKRADYHMVVQSYLKQICDFMEQQGFAAKGFVDSNPLPERYLAYLAGVGFIGRNNMIITKKYGSFVFLGEILTDLEIDCETSRTFEDITNYTECGDCHRCRKACPTKSINPEEIHPNICLSYLTQKKELTDSELSLLGKNVFGCDYCQLACPYNQQAVRYQLKEFSSVDCMNLEVKAYADMDNAFFKQAVKLTSCGWRGKNVIRRNAMIRLSRQGKDLSEYISDSEYLNEYIRRLSAGKHGNKEK